MKKYSKLYIAYWSVRAFIHNTFAEWHNRRLENKRRPWTALKVGGGGVVPLGKLNQKDAIRETARFGSIQYVDTEVAAVFYGDKLA